MAKTLRKTACPKTSEFMHASRDEMQSLQEGVVPLTRKLAARLSRKRRHGRKGPLDFRNNVRHSLCPVALPIDPNVSSTRGRRSQS